MVYLLTILLMIALLEIVAICYLTKKKADAFDELLEDCNKLIDTQLKLEDIIINAKTSKELPFMTVEKIEKVLFPNTTFEK